MEDIFGAADPPTPEAEPDPAPLDVLHPDMEPEEEVFDTKAGLSENPPPSPPSKTDDLPKLRDITIPDTDGYLAKEQRLYEMALETYETALLSESEKVRLQAAKDIVSIYTQRRDTATKTAAKTQENRSTTNNHLHITVDSVRNALSAALHGIEGGLKEGVTDERNVTAEAELGEGTSLPPEFDGPLLNDNGEEE